MCETDGEPRFESCRRRTIELGITINPHQMLTDSTHHTQAQLKQLRWFVQLRWLAGVAAIAVSLAAGQWMAWDGQYVWAMGLGAAVLVYNIPLWMITQARSQRWNAERFLVMLAWAQIALDLACLTLITVWTGGINSPLRGFFVLHMVLSSLVLSSPNSYLASLVAIVMLLTGLAGSDQWPATRPEVLTLLGWVAILPLTVFLTTHIVADLRSQHTDARDQHQRLRAILETAADGIITINDRGLIESTNPAADQTFGYRAGELIGRNIKMLMPEPYHSEHDGYLDNFLRTRVPKIIGIGREVVGLRKDGSTFPLDLAVSEVSLHGRTLFTGILRDITQRKAAEQELLTLNQELQRHQQAMIQQEKMAAMGQMAAGIVHEISNPLASMDSLLQLVQRHPDRLNQNTLQQLQEQVTRIHRITRQLTDFAHPNETALESRPLNEIVQQALEMVRFDHRIREVEVVKQFDPDAGSARVLVHSIQQVLLNMILNALDAMSGVASPRLTLSTKSRGQWKAIEITDNGQGIAQENLARIFEPFFTTKPLGKGTGLGLSISYNLVQRHGGRCEVESDTTPGRSGTTFRILLPATPA